MKNDRIYLDHILECIGWIESFTAEGRDAFFKDRKTQSAVLRELQTLAESTQRLSDEFKGQYPNIPWQNMAGFRNVIVHDYLGTTEFELLEAYPRLKREDIRGVIRIAEEKFGLGPGNS
jgi:uncharacterized protein with HEPN domain